MKKIKVLLKVIYYLFAIVGIAAFMAVMIIPQDEYADNHPLILWKMNYVEGYQLASAQDKPVLLYFYSDNCSACAKMKFVTFKNDDLIRIINNLYIPIKINIDNNIDELNAYGITALPTIVVRTNKKNILAEYIGYQEPKQLASKLSIISAVSGAYTPENISHTLLVTRFFNNSPMVLQNKNNVSEAQHEECEGNVCLIQSNQPSSKLNLSFNNKISVNAPVEKLGEYQALLSHNLYLIFIVFVFAGLMISFTPCVFPLLIMMASFLIASRAAASKIIFLKQVVIYVLSLSFAYMVLGMLSASTGHYIEHYLGNIYVISIESLILVFLGLTMLGFGRIKLPAKWHHAVVRYNKMKLSYSDEDIAVMGLVTSLIAAPCISAPLVSVLIFVNQSQSMLLGSVALFSLGIGLCMPLIAACIIGPELLPNPKTWGYHLKAITGFILFAIALFLFNDIIPSYRYHIIWGYFAMIVAIYFHYQLANSHQWMWRSFIYLIFLFGMMYASYYIYLRMFQIIQ